MLSKKGSRQNDHSLTAKLQLQVKLERNCVSFKCLASLHLQFLPFKLSDFLPVRHQGMCCTSSEARQGQHVHISTHYHIP